MSMVIDNQLLFNHRLLIYQRRIHQSVLREEDGSKPFGLMGKPFGLVTDPFGLMGKPFGLVTDPFGLMVKPFGLMSNLFGLVTDPFGLMGKPFGKTILQKELKGWVKTVILCWLVGLVCALDLCFKVKKAKKNG